MLTGRALFSLPAVLLLLGTTRGAAGGAWAAAPAEEAGARAGGWRLDEDAVLISVERRGDLRASSNRRRLEEVQPVRIRGPSTKVLNCVKCPVAHVPEMCSYQAGTEPPGARWEDYQQLDRVGPPEGSALGAAAGEEAGAERNWLHLRGHAHAQHAAEGQEAGQERPAVPEEKPAPRAPAKRAKRGRRGRSRHLLAVAASQPRFIPPQEKTANFAHGILARWKSNPRRCGLWTRECVERYHVKGEDLGIEGAHPADPALDPLKKLFAKGTFPQDNKELLARFPDLEPGELGSCAVVAVGDNVIKKGRGAEIDAHDTVFRYNSPMKAFKKDVGGKSDVMYWKMRSNEKDYGQEGQRASRFYMWKDASKFMEFGKPADWAANTFRGLPLLWPNPPAESQKLWLGIYQKYKEDRKLSRGTPAGGFKFASDVLSSGLCKRVDLYGYTAQGSGKYFKRASLMKSVHISGLEHWVYREAQSMGMLCLYD
mmetsp:Transcript_7189/g.18457  ORF Transcript_7189/g.18457 Transcript_7189/m.18457 type:complete len:483 (-) Transcript_7189:19-1467(-)